MSLRQAVRTAACVALALAAARASPRGQAATAPDGQRGLGTQTQLQDLLSFVRSTHDDDRAFFGALHTVGTEVRILVASVVERYRQRGYFALLDDRDPKLDALHAAFATLDPDPLARLAANDAGSRALSHMLLDPRFRARIHVLEGWDFEVREVEHGVAVLRAMTDGYVVLTQDEASNICKRVDASASLLRAMRNDLQALQPGEIDPAAEKAAELAAVELVRLATSSEGEKVRRAAIEPAIADARAQADKIESVLFTSRLTQQLAQFLEWRTRLFQAAAPLRSEALQWLPDTPEGRGAPDAITHTPRDDRMRRAAAVARQGLSIDPLDDVLAWACAHAVDFHWGVPESRPLYDRFLALHGIRAHDHRTYQRELDAREREALDAVQRMIIPGKPPATGF